MTTKLITSSAIFTLFAYGLNTPVGSESGNMAINAGIALLVAIVVFKKIVTPKYIQAKKAVHEFMNWDDLFSHESVTALPVNQPENKKAKSVKTSKAVSAKVVDAIDWSQLEPIRYQ